MTDIALSQALKEAYASAPSAEVILHTLELRHPSFTQPLRVVNDHATLSARLEASAPANPSTWVDFVPFSFRFRLPDVQSTGMPELEVEIDNVSAEVLAYIDQAAQSTSLIELTYRPFLASDLTAPQMDPPITLVLHDVEASIFSIRARASFGEYGNRRFPGETYDAQRFPGLIAT
ncbi:DUF1833 family protein [Pseudomonas sp.]|uniref:DUF1833 family protein n=1 Tax=Pseudomonas sp. TaxID=306 RepID=UPI0025886DCA|nr:DUF1833 family protein [Pseudomonas sp.]